MEVSFHTMIDKLKSGVWEYATTTTWAEDGGKYVTMDKIDDRIYLVVHEGREAISPWTLNTNDSINMKFIELKFWKY